MGVLNVGQLCFNATTLRNYDIIDAVKYIKDAGYDAVEIALNDTHIHPLKTDKERLHQVKKCCEDIGLVIACAAAGGPTLLGTEPYEPSMVCSSGEGREKRIDVYKKSIELAQEIGSPIVNINTGILKSDVLPEQAHEYFLDGINKLLPECGDTILVLEQEPGFFVGTTDKAIDYLNLINSPKLMFNLDIGHVFATEPEEDCYDNVAKSMPYTRHIHIEDIKNRIHHHEIPGEGDIDFNRILKIIKDAEYKHYVCVELHHHDQMWQRALIESRDYLRNIWSDL